MLEIHFFVPAQLGAAFAKQVRDGWIVNMTDALADKPNLSWQNYRMSKLFLEELTRQQALLFAPHCRVNAIAPGAVLPSDDKRGGAFRKLAAQIPLRKTQPVTAITDAFRFLVSSTSCTGQIIRVDGGWSLTG
jgi:pteridine reductase